VRQAVVVTIADCGEGPLRLTPFKPLSIQRLRVREREFEGEASAAICAVVLAVLAAEDQSSIQTCVSPSIGLGEPQAGAADALVLPQAAAFGIADGAQCAMSNWWGAKALGLFASMSGLVRKT
jgi:hypothetical protein